jgi:hypothetical protein
MVLMHSFLLLQSECCFFLCTRESTSHLYDTLIYGCRSLGLLNFIRLWHDNSGSGSSASWFLKCIIVQDLQTMERTYFIAQRWFAVEEDDGRVCVRCFRSNVYCLWLVVRREREAFAYLFAKKVYHRISEGHLWFSIFSRPPSHEFTRVQRCTCCFVLLFISMLLNIRYYDRAIEAQMDHSSSSSSSKGIAIGPMLISAQQVGHTCVVVDEYRSMTD